MIFLFSLLAAHGVMFFFFRKKSLFESLPIFLNTVLAIYISIMLTPTILGWVGELQTSGYYYALVMLVVAGLVFFVAFTVSRYYLTADITLPRLVNLLGSLTCGFFTGYFTFKFVILILGVTPLAEAPAAQKMAGDQLLGKSVAGTMTNLCRTVHVFSFQVRDPLCSDLINAYTEVPNTIKHVQTKSSNDNDDPDDRDEDHPDREPSGNGDGY